MRCAIMQPTYMPWSGYLNLMDQVDCFIYLDDAQYERSSWQNRNRVLVKGEPMWLSVPVRRGHLGSSINDVAVDEVIPWRRKHGALLKNAYARHPYAKDLLEVVDFLENEPSLQLADVNIELLGLLREKLGIVTPTVRSSTLGVPGVRTARLIEMLEKMGATEYVTPPGALGYLEEDGFVNRTSIRLYVHNFDPTEYSQKDRSTFMSHLSILDVVAHLGWSGSSAYIRPPSETIRIY